MKYAEEIKNIMANYAEMRKLERIFEKEGRTYGMKQKLDFFDFCIELLETYEKELFLSVGVNGISMRQYARATGFSRNFVSKEKNRIIEMFDRFFMVKFDSP